jgi:hypothetical protein
MVKKSLQHAFVTPRRPPSSSFVNTSFDAVPSSPIVEGGGFWDLDTEDARNESQTDFTRACIAGPSSPADTQGSEELPQSADLRRRVSLQQGTGTLLVSFLHASHNPEQLICVHLDAMNL